MLSLHAEWGENLYLSYWKAQKLDLYRSGVTLNPIQSLGKMGMLPKVKTLMAPEAAYITPENLQAGHVGPCFYAQIST